MVVRGGEGEGGGKGRWPLEAYICLLKGGEFHPIALDFKSAIWYAFVSYIK